MKFLPTLDLYEIDPDEALYILSGLRQMGYLWLQEGGKGRHHLYDRSGDVCVGEVFNRKLYVDIRVHEDLVRLTFHSGGAGCGS